MLSFQQMLICFACAGPCWCASTTSSTCCVSRSWEFRSTPSTPSQWASLSSRPNPSTSTHGSFETWSNFSVLPACVTLILVFFSSPLPRNCSQIFIKCKCWKFEKKKCTEMSRNKEDLSATSHYHIDSALRKQDNKIWKTEQGTHGECFFFPTCFL